MSCHEAGLCCYLVMHIENLLCPLQLFYFHLWLIYWLSLVCFGRHWRSRESSFRPQFWPIMCDCVWCRVSKLCVFRYEYLQVWCVYMNPSKVPLSSLPREWECYAKCNRVAVSTDTRNFDSGLWWGSEVKVRDILFELNVRITAKFKKVISY
jgi:hypothetical protein